MKMSKSIELHMSEGLSNHGVSKIKIDDRSVVLEYDGKALRSTLHRDDIDKTIKAFERRCKDYVTTSIVKTIHTGDNCKRGSRGGGLR
jgi:hypothetical protein